MALIRSRLQNKLRLLHVFQRCVKHHKLSEWHNTDCYLFLGLFNGVLGVSCFMIHFESHDYIPK
jgi:hypothetical protein